MSWMTICSSEPWSVSSIVRIRSWLSGRGTCEPSSASAIAVASNGPIRDGQESLALEVLENHDRVVRQQVDAELVDLHLAHHLKSHVSRMIPGPEGTRDPGYVTILWNRRPAQRRKVDDLQCVDSFGPGARGELPVRDDRAERRRGSGSGRSAWSVLREIVSGKRIVPAQMRFVDIAGSRARSEYGCRVSAMRS